MFTTYFNMSHQPFREHAPADAILKHERVTQNLARLSYLVEDGIVALVSGQTGLGKSALLKHFMAGLKPNQVQAHYLHLTPLKATSLLSLIVHKLGETPKRGKDKLFLQILGKKENQKIKILLVIDEAHLLSTEALIDIRLLVSSALDEEPKLKIVLAGQDGLRKKLKQEALADLANRISVQARLYPLTREETVQYIDHQLNWAGANDKILDIDVKHMVHEYAAGVPRQINTLATACLLQAVAAKKQKITLDFFNTILDEIKIL